METSQIILVSIAGIFGIIAVVLISKANKLWREAERLGKEAERLGKEARQMADDFEKKYGYRP